MSNYKTATLRHHNVVSGMNTFTFNTREEYLEFRKEWKENYKFLSVLIKKTKSERKIFETAEGRSSTQSKCHWLRVEARTQMEILTEAKEHRAMQCESEKEIVNG